MSIDYINKLVVLEAMKQLQIPKSWITDALENSDSDDDYVEDSEAKKQSKICYWTRVKSLSQMKD